MKDWHFAEFVQEVLTQAQVVELSISDLQETLNSPGLRSNLRSFLSLQSALSGAAMLSKLFWPNSSKYDEKCQALDVDGLRLRQAGIERGRLLRDKLGVSESDPVFRPLRPRTLRNAFEHFDSRLDKLFLDLPAQPNLFVDLIIGPIRDLASGPIDVPHSEVILRNIDPQRGTVSILGEELLLGDLIVAANQCGHRARKWMDEHPLYLVS